MASFAELDAGRRRERDTAIGSFTCEGRVFGLWQDITVRDPFGRCGRALTITLSPAHFAFLDGSVESPLEEDLYVSGTSMDGHSDEWVRVADRVRELELRNAPSEARPASDAAAAASAAVTTIQPTID